jgi:hypothetical protein
MKIEEGRKGMEGETSNIERPTSNIERKTTRTSTRRIMRADYDIDIGAVKRTHRGVISP